MIPCAVHVAQAFILLQTPFQTQSETMAPKASKKVARKSLVKKRPAGTCSDRLVAFQIYRRGEKKHFAFSRVYQSKLHHAKAAKQILLQRWEDEAWSDDRLRREFQELAKRCRDYRRRAKKKRGSDKVAVRMLMCVPSIFENIAKALLIYFGTLPALIGALNSPQSFPRVQLNDHMYLDKKQIEILTTYFCKADTN